MHPLGPPAWLRPCARGVFWDPIKRWHLLLSLLCLLSSLKQASGFHAMGNQTALTRIYQKGSPKQGIKARKLEAAAAALKLFSATAFTHENRKAAGKLRCWLEWSAHILWRVKGEEPIALCTACTTCQ